MAYEPLGPVTRAPLSPPPGYAPSSDPATLPVPMAPHAYSAPGGAEGEWRASPRWAAVEGDGCIVVEQDRANAEPDSGRVRVENCTPDDIGEP